MHPIKRLFYVTLSVLVLTAGIWTAYADSEKNPGRETIRVGFFATDGLHMIDDGGEKSDYGYALLRYMSRYLDVSYENMWATIRAGRRCSVCSMMGRSTW